MEGGRERGIKWRGKERENKGGRKKERKGGRNQSRERGIKMIGSN